MPVAAICPASLMHKASLISGASDVTSARRSCIPAPLLRNAEVVPSGVAVQPTTCPDRLIDRARLKSLGEDASDPRSTSAPSRATMAWKMSPERTAREQKRVLFGLHGDRTGNVSRPIDETTDARLHSGRVDVFERAVLISIRGRTASGHGPDSGDLSRIVDREPGAEERVGIDVAELPAFVQERVRLAGGCLRLADDCTGRVDRPRKARIILAAPAAEDTDIGHAAVRIDEWVLVALGCRRVADDLARIIHRRWLAHLAAQGSEVRQHAVVVKPAREGRAFAGARGRVHRDLSSTVESHDL